MVDLSEA